MLFMVRKWVYAEYMDKYPHAFNLQGIKQYAKTLQAKQDRDSQRTLTEQEKKEDKQKKLKKL